jgi:predicted TIM-barrel fold metal-dependent hydrolase
MIIDFHAHYPRQEDFLSRLIESLPKVGIDRICLSSAGEEFGHVSNLEVRAAFEQYPDKIIGLANVQLGKDSPHVIDEYVKQGFRGIKIINPLAPYDDPSYFPLYERMELYHLPVLFHTGIVMRTPCDRERQVSSIKMTPARLDAVARSFSGLNIVAAHLGAPWYEEASMMARIHPNFYVDLTGACWGGWRANKGADFYRYHFFWPGAWEKIVFGTDILRVEELESGKRVHDQIFNSLGLDQQSLDQIYGGTAARLLNLGSRSQEEAATS